MPAFNAEATLAESMRSALASSYSALELVLVDDGSSDETVAIAETLAQGDARVRIFRQRHSGVSAALNFGLTHVRGEFVARLDADDLWHPTKLAKQVKMLTADPATMLTYTHVRYIDGSGRIFRDAAPQNLTGPALCQILYSGIVGGGSSALFCRSVLDAVGGFDERLGVWEDLVMHLKVGAAGQIGCVAEYLTGYRVGGDSSSDLDRSLQAWRLAHKLIECEFPQVPAFVHGWSHARRLLELAEGFAHDKRYRTSGALLAECLANDPVRTSAFLAYRLHRRLLGNRRPLYQPGPLFAEADTDTSYGLSDFDAGLEGHRVRALDQSRERLMRAIDSELSPRPQSTDAAETTAPAAADP
ncbi:MAG: glycosyltransferase family 2 protein [Pseudomonadota bacterium]